MTDSKATPRPWKVFPVGPYHEAHIRRDGTPSGYVAFDIGIEDAALIVEAVNSHDAMKSRIAELEAALKSLIAACDEGRMVERGSGGMTIEAQIRRSVINGVPAWPVEEARVVLEKDRVE